MNWSDGRIKGFIVSTLRGAMRRWPPKWEALADAYVGKKVNSKTKRASKHYKCAGCGEGFPQAQVEVDHKEPVVDPKTGFISWDIFISRLFCEKENLQVLCKDCHKIKTKKERNVKNSTKES